MCHDVGFPQADEIMDRDMMTLCRLILIGSRGL